MHTLSRRVLSALLVASLSVTPLLPRAAAAPAVMTRADYEACHTGDEAAFRSAIESIAFASLSGAAKAIDFRASIEAEWRRLGVDEILDKRVDLAVEEVRKETSWSGLAKSLVNTEAAQELAKTVAERVYRSEPVHQAIEGLATGVGTEVGRTIEPASKDAAGPALECVRAFLGPRYGSTVAGVVSGNVETDFGVVDPAKGGATVSSGSVLNQSTEGITGAAILLVRRQLANMASRIGQRLAGSVLSRLVSVVAGGVGLVLIAKDIWELRNGVLPIIADEMKAPGTKDKVKEELASTISTQINEHVREIAASTADRVLDIWREFRKAHEKVLELAEHHDAFRKLLDSVEPARMARLDEVTAMLIASDGEQGLLSRLENGSLNEAVRFMPEQAMTIARDTRSLDAALGWTALAGDRLDKVLEHEIYRRSDPAAFTRANLAKLLALDDHLAITRLAALPADAREKLFGISRDELKRLARSLSEDELATISGYLTGLEKGPRDRVLAAVANAPGKMQILSSPRLRDAVIGSADQAAAVEMMLREGSGDAATLVADFRAVYDGRIAPILIWEKHPVLVGAAGVLALVLLLMLRRLLHPRHRPSSRSITETARGA